MTYGFCAYHEIECDYSGECIECPHNTEEDKEWFIQDEQSESDDKKSENNTYQKELSDVRHSLLSRPDQYITFRDLVERFDDVDAEFNHSSWDLLQIYNNFDILIGAERDSK